MQNYKIKQACCYFFTVTFVFNTIDSLFINVIFVLIIAVPFFLPLILPLNLLAETMLLLVEVNSTLAILSPQTSSHSSEDTQSFLFAELFQYKTLCLF